MHQLLTHFYHKLAHGAALQQFFFVHISCFLFLCVDIHIGIKRDKYEKRSPTKTWLKSRIFLDLQIPLKSDSENNDEDEGNAVDDDNDNDLPS